MEPVVYLGYSGFISFDSHLGDFFFLNKELAYVIIEAEKSQDLPSVSWRPIRINGVVPVQVRR